MTRATLQRFETPERLILTVAEPRRATVRMDVRVAGLRAEGGHRYIETEDGRRMRRDHVQSAGRPGGGTVDLDATLRALQGLPPLPADHNSFENHMTRFGIGILLTPVLGAIALGVYFLADGALTGPEAWQVALLLLGVPVLVVGVYVVLRALRDIRNGFGKDGRD